MAKEDYYDRDRISELQVEMIKLGKVEGATPKSIINALVFLGYTKDEISRAAYTMSDEY